MIDETTPELSRDVADVLQALARADSATDAAASWDHKTLEVALLWQGMLFDIKHYPMHASVHIGAHADNDFRVQTPTVAAAHFALVEATAAGPLVHWTDKMVMAQVGQDGVVHGRDMLLHQGTVELNASQHYGYRLGLHDRLALQCDALTFVIRFVSPAARLPNRDKRGRDVLYWGALAAAVSLHALVVLLLWQAPSVSPASHDDTLNTPAHIARLALRQFRNPENLLHPAFAPATGAQQHKAAQAAASEAAAMRSTPTAAAASKTDHDRKVVMASGLLKALTSGKLAGMSDVLAGGGLGAGMNRALAGLRGGSHDNHVGSLTGHGHGADATGKSVGISGMVQSSSFGAGGMGHVDLGGKGVGGVGMLPGKVTTEGCLSEAVVARILKHVEPQARYCYEMELPRKPDLNGKVVTTLAIAASGGVTGVRVTSSTLGNASVENCLVRVLQRIHFPPCAGGGDAEASYPWLFKPTGR